MRLIATFVDNEAYIAGELTGSTFTDGKVLGLALFDAGSVAPKSLESDYHYRNITKEEQEEKELKSIMDFYCSNDEVNEDDYVNTDDFFNDIG